MSRTGTDPARPAAAQIAFELDDNRLLPVVYGEHNQHLARIEHAHGVTIQTRGNHVTVTGDAEACGAARLALEGIWDRAHRALPVGRPEINAILREVAGSSDAAMGRRSIERFNDDRLALRTKRRDIVPRTPRQGGYIEAMQRCEMVFGLGPAGTGKTYLAVAQAVTRLMAREVDRIVLSRPAVEAGERLGFLPGDLKDKVDPYLRPLYDALHDMLPGREVQERIDSGDIEIAPLAFMRGRTLSHAFVIVDEAQNTTAMQMKMLLTRMGEGSRMVITGDVTQVDLPAGQRSGLREAIGVLNGIEGIGFVYFNDEDVVRHPLVSRIVRAYDAFEARQGQLPFQSS